MSAASLARLPRGLDTSTIAVYVLLIVTIAVFVTLDPAGLDGQRLATVLAHRLPLVLAAVGQAVVILNRGFDLSVSGVVALTNVVVATQIGGGAGGIVRGVAVGLAVGLLAGAINGALVGFLRLPAIIATLATWSVFGGAALYVLPQPGGSVPAAFAAFPFQRFAGIPVALLLMVGLPALLWWPIARSPLGHEIAAVGGDERAAYESGLSVARARFAAFVISCGFAASAGIVLTMQAASGDPRIGNPFTLNSIAAVALGGASLAGGRASIAASVAGGLVLGTLANVLFLAGVSTYWQFVVAGSILVVAVALGNLTRRRGAVVR